MFFNKTDTKREAILDRAGRDLVRASGLSESECDAVASSPYLYARIRTRIEREESAGRQSFPAVAMLTAAWRAAAALAVVALVAVATSWMSTSQAPVPGSIPSDQKDNVELIATGGTCALSNADECAISTEEVLATLLRDVRELER